MTARRARAGAGPSPEARDGYLLGLDVGTGSCRAALFTLDGRPAALARREWTHAPAPGIPGSQSFDPAGNWALICACIREVLRSAPSPAAVRAVGCSSMGGGLVLYGRGGQELWACANGDTRAEREAAVMLADGTAAELYRRAGGWRTPNRRPAARRSSRAARPGRCRTIHRQARSRITPGTPSRAWSGPCAPAWSRTGPTTSSTSGGFADPRPGSALRGPDRRG